MSCFTGAKTGPECYIGATSGIRHLLNEHVLLFQVKGAWGKGQVPVKGAWGKGQVPTGSFRPSVLTA